MHDVSLAGIVPDEVVEPMPPLLLALCKCLVRWGVLPRAKKPDSCIIKVYAEVGRGGV